MAPLFLRNSFGSFFEAAFKMLLWNKRFVALNMYKIHMRSVLVNSIL